ncbi:hypothetical protein JL721_12219 [Aureococcus anophagefferens]|nr:hypothetical protein JL721_12219 [Aureococcus anophagefferens]
MYLSFLVGGVNGEALVSEAGFSAFAYAMSDVVSFLSWPQNILDLTATFGEDDAASIEVVIAMDTCATFGHSSNEDCLDHGVVDVANAVVDGAMLERILYWADYFGLDIGDDLTVDSIVSDPEPYWVYAPTPAPTSTTCSGLAKKRCKKTAGCAYKKKTCISCSGLSKKNCKKTGLRPQFSAMCANPKDGGESCEAAWTAYAECSYESRAREAGLACDLTCRGERRAPRRSRRCAAVVAAAVAALA